MTKNDSVYNIANNQTKDEDQIKLKMMILLFCLINLKTRKSVNARIITTLLDIVTTINISEIIVNPKEHLLKDLVHLFLLFLF